MNELSDIVSSANEKMESIEEGRDYAITMSRSIKRKTKNVLHAIHTGDDSTKLQSELVSDVETMLSKVKDVPEIYFSQIVTDTCAEYAEAMIISAIVNEKSIPSFESLNISPGSWMMGLADAVGELRRLVLTNLMADDLKKAKFYFEYMENIGAEVMKFDVPDAIVPIRRKQDIARGVIEKTRSDVANAIVVSKIKS